MKGTTKSGFKFDIPDENLSDMRLVDALAELNDGDFLKVSTVVKILFAGTAGKQELYDHLADEEGRVSMDKVSEEVVEIFLSGQESKNS